MAAILFQKLNRVELNLDDMAKLKSAAERGYGVTRDLIPVAAQLSAEHMLVVAGKSPIACGTCLSPPTEQL